MRYEALEVFNRLLGRLNNLERNLMKPDTIKKGQTLIANIQDVDEQVKLWSKLRKGQLRYNYDTAAYRDFGNCNKHIPDAIYEAFRSSMVNALKVKHAELTKELEDLQDPVEDNHNDETPQITIDGKPAYFDKGFD